MTTRYISVVLSLIALTVRTTEARQCGTQSDEIFVSVQPNVHFKIRIIQHSSQDTLYTSPELHDEVSPKCEDYVWIASTDDADSGWEGENTTMTLQIAYELQFLELSGGSWQSQHSFLYYDCAGTGSDDPFYCPINGNQNDFYIHYRGNGDYDYWGFGLPDGNIEEAFDDELWIMPLDKGYVCSAFNEHNEDCITSNPGYFLTPQVGDGAWTHTSRDLVFIGGGSWGQSVTLSGQHSLELQSGTELIVESGASLVLGAGIAVELPSGGAVEVSGRLKTAGSTIVGPDGSGSGSGSTTRIDDVRIEIGSSGQFLIGQSSDTFGSGWTGIRVTSSATASFGENELVYPSAGVLEVYGELQIQGGGAGYEATLDGTSGGSWDGVVFESGSQGSIEYATIRNAGVEIYNASPSIQYTTIDKGGSESAVYVSGSASDIRLMYSDIINVKASSGFVYGVYFASSSDGLIGHTDIYVESSDWGEAVSANSYATAQAGNWPYTTGGHNQFNGAQYTNKAAGGGLVLSGAFPYGGYNHYCPDANYDMYTTASGTIYSVNNYFRDGGSRSYGNVSSVYESAGGTCYTGKGFGATQPAVATAEPAELSPGDEDLASAFSLTLAAHADPSGRASGHFNQAADLFRKVASEQRGRVIAENALVGLVLAARYADEEGWLRYVEDIARGDGPERSTALGLLIQAYQYWGETNLARTTARELIRESGDDDWETLYAKLSLFAMDVEENDFAGAADILGETTAHDDFEAEEIGRAWKRLSRRTGVSVPPIRRAGEGTATGVTGQAPVLEAEAYPNPFNPETTVTFALGDKSAVRIEVFDLAGRRVGQVASGTYAAGRYSVGWNAAGLPSGTYFIVVHAGPRTRVLPVNLAK